MAHKGKPNPRIVELLPESLSLNFAQDGTFLQFQLPDGSGAAINLQSQFGNDRIVGRVITHWDQSIRKAKGLQ